MTSVRDRRSTTEAAAQAIDACRQSLRAVDTRVPGVAADVRRALVVPDRIASDLSRAGDKQLYRVLEAVREGYDTSELIAAHLHAGRNSIADDLHTLYACGTLRRLKDPATPSRAAVVSVSNCFRRLTNYQVDTRAIVASRRLLHQTKGAGRPRR